MREHFALDHQPEYQVKELPETTRVVNPAWRELDRQRRSLLVRVNRKLVEFARVSLPEGIDPEKTEAFLQKKKTAQKQADTLQQELAEIKAKLKQTEHYVRLSQLPKEEQFNRLSSGAKDLVDTIKLIAYRAETAMAQVVREHLPKGRVGEERRLLQSLYGSEADLVPNQTEGTLTVNIHHPANPLLGRAAQSLCEELTLTNTMFPTTNLRIIYQLVSK